MEQFYTPEEVHELCGISTQTLAHWRANLIGPDCIRWRGKILYHSDDIQEWFETGEIDADATKKKKSNMKKVAIEKQPEVPKPKPEAKLKKPDIEEHYNDVEPEEIRWVKIEKPSYLDGFLSTFEVAEKLKVSTSTLANWRYQNKGPKSSKFGNRVYYKLEFLEKWLETHTVKPTMD